ncbi:MAG TPA: SURF1 family cytochrome oxidase biogenesis protein [Croceibacterium sp.]
MTRKLPVLPTLVVAAAIAAMLALGVWQLRRAEWKAALLARYEQAQAMSANVPWPRDAASLEQALFRWSQFECREVHGIRTTAATNAAGESGVAQVARCEIDGGGEAEVALGWSTPTQQIDWDGGRVSGIIGPGGTFGGTLHASPPAPGLAPLAPPDPADLPNNHLAYAGQWFFFALTALVIYVLALRRRGSRPGR